MKNSKYLKIICLSLTLLIILSGCTFGRKSNNNEGKINIVTSFYPVYISTINITKGIPNVTVTNMTQPQTGCLHDYQISPQDLETLESASAFVINGAGMEAFMDKVIASQKNLKIIDASKDIPLIKNSSDGEDNPHVWVSISNNILQVRNIAKELSLYDPSNASSYNANADTYIARLELLQKEMHKELDGLQNKNIITFHEAFPYFAKEFNLNIAAVIEREPGSEPSAKELADTITLVKGANVKALFAEPQYPAKAAQTIATETSSKVYTLDPIVTGPMDAGAYINIMGKNLLALKEALRVPLP